MRDRFLSCASIVLLAATLTVSAQQAPAPAAPGRIGGAGIGAYPQREAADPAAVERGKGIYGTYCAFCHGPDTRGGGGGPSILRSQVVLDDQNGELIGVVVLAGRQDRGMPKFTLTGEQIADIAAFVHTFRVNGYDVSRQRPPSILVGDARAGEVFFNAKCSSCHSVAGDLRGLASRIADERQLQQMWLMPGSLIGRGGPPVSRPRRAAATVTLPSGEKIEGQLERADDFTVSLRLSDGSRRSFRIAGDTLKVELHDALQPHKDLLRTYTDADIHNVTAYLATLK